MKIFKKLAVALMSLPVLAGLTACGEDYAEYVPTAVDGTSYAIHGTVFFPSENEREQPRLMFPVDHKIPLSDAAGHFMA